VVTSTSLEVVHVTTFYRALLAPAIPLMATRPAGQRRSDVEADFDRMTSSLNGQLPSPADQLN
jgi:hypothetical protein